MKTSFRVALRTQGSILVVFLPALLASAAEQRAGDAIPTPPAKEEPADEIPAAAVAKAAKEGKTLKVLSLNVAHGRGEGRNQALQKRAEIEKHLQQVAAVLRRQQPDVAGLQEADGPSAWSGNFNHVAELARLAEFPHSFRGEHVGALKLSYGTALLSRWPLVEPRSTTFAPSPPTPNKGFVTARVAWPGVPELRVEITSLHLDFARKSVRTRQVNELATALAQRRRLRDMRFSRSPIHLTAPVRWPTA
jgi:endonuclease/exonuclease/phosphatase family metal-dependent hydrolase